MELGKNIRKFREAAGMTQEQLASLLNISSQAVSKWERDDSMPDSAMLPAIADCLGVSIDRLFARNNATMEDVEYEIARYMRKMTQKEMLNAIRQIAYFCEVVMFSVPNSTHWTEYFENREWELTRCSHSVCNETEYGFTFSSNRPELPFYSVFPEPEKGWKDALKKEDFDGFFEVMSDESVRSTLFALYEEENISFDGSYAERKFGLSDPDTILSKIQRLGVLRSESCNIDGKETRIWNFRNRCGIIAIFSVLNEFLYHNRSFDMQSNDRHTPYLRTKEGTE